MTRMMAFLLLFVVAAAPAAAQTEYVIGPQDVLTITVFDQSDLSGKFAVDADGTFVYPLLGRIKAGGLTLRAVETEIKRQLSGDYLKNPQVTVAVEQYRSQRVFIHGEVRTPGTYALTGDMTLIEALARAGHRWCRRRAASQGCSDGLPAGPSGSRARCWRHRSVPASSPRSPSCRPRGGQ